MAGPVCILVEIHETLAAARKPLGYYAKPFFSQKVYAHPGVLNKRSEILLLRLTHSVGILEHLEGQPRIVFRQIHQWMHRSHHPSGRKCKGRCRRPDHRAAFKPRDLPSQLPLGHHWEGFAVDHFVPMLDTCGFPFGIFRVLFVFS